MAFFTHDKREGRGVAALLLAFVLLIGLAWVVGRDKQHRNVTTDTSQCDSRKTETRNYSQAERQVETFEFDPNTADSTTLLRLGLTPPMVRGIYKYRAMGYVYATPEDFARVPGMTNGLWERLAPCIRIDRRFQAVTHPSQPRREQAWHDDVPRERDSSRIASSTMRQPKLKAGETIDINTADTTLLKMVPGIGTHFAGRIVSYRQQLGGFASIAQLEEIDGFPLGAMPFLKVEGEVKKIDVNHCSKNDLLRHPYLRTYRAMAIWKYRHDQGPLHSIEDLRKLPDFSEHDIKCITPYLLFR